MSLRIVMVDDQDINGLLFEIYCKKKGWEYRWFACAETFLKKADIQNYDIVFVDWFMPGMNGLDLCDIIRGKSKIPLVLCSANSLPSDKEEALKHADDYVLKPVNRQEFYDIVEKYCGKNMN